MTREKGTTRITLQNGDVYTMQSKNHALQTLHHIVQKMTPKPMWWIEWVSEWVRATRKYNQTRKSTTRTNTGQTKQTLTRHKQEDKDACVDAKQGWVDRENKGQKKKRGRADHKKNGQNKQIARDGRHGRKKQREAKGRCKRSNKRQQD